MEGALLLLTEAEEFANTRIERFAHRGESVTGHGLQIEVGITRHPPHDADLHGLERAIRILVPW